MHCCWEQRSYLRSSKCFQSIETVTFPRQSVALQLCSSVVMNFCLSFTRKDIKYITLKIHLWQLLNNLFVCFCNSFENIPFISGGNFVNMNFIITFIKQMPGAEKVREKMLRYRIRRNFIYWILFFNILQQSSVLQRGQENFIFKKFLFFVRAFSLLKFFASSLMIIFSL